MTRTAATTAIAEKIQKYAFIPAAVLARSAPKTTATARSTAAPILRNDDSILPGRRRINPAAPASARTKIRAGAITPCDAGVGAGEPATAVAARAIEAGANEGSASMICHSAAAAGRKDKKALFALQG